MEWWAACESARDAPFPARAEGGIGISARRKPAFDHSGSSFDSILEEEGILDKAEAVAVKRATDSRLDVAARADAAEGIRQGLEDAGNGESPASPAVLRRVRSRPWPASLKSRHVPCATLPACMRRSTLGIPRRR